MFFDVTFEVIGAITVEAEDEHSAMMLVDQYGGDDLIADSMVRDVHVIEAHAIS